MAISDLDIKLLWGRSGNICAICTDPISVNPDDISDKGYHLGEQAHIAGEKPSSTRHNPNLNDKEVNSYENILLLCPTCHTKIDKDPTAFTVDKLHIIKSAHERKILNKLTELNSPTTDPSIQDQLYMHLVDETVRLAHILKWEQWTSMYAKSHGVLPANIWQGITALRISIAASIWPGTDLELEKSLQTFSIAARAMVDCFMEHSIPRLGQSPDDPTVYDVDRFYKAQHYPDNTYNKLLSKFNNWESAREQLLIEATCSLNWLADSVRARLDPSFFLLHGKFKYETGLMMDLSTRIRLPEYNDQAKTEYPDLIQNRIDEILSSYKTDQ